MSEETQAPEATEEEARPQILVDDVSYYVDELPDAIRGAINTYNVWVADRGEAQKKAAQLASAVQHLASQISQAIKDHTAEQEAAEAGVATAGEDALEITDAESEAALDIPAEEE